MRGTFNSSGHEYGKRQRLSFISIPRCLQGCRRGLGCYNGKIASLQELWEKMTFFPPFGKEMVKGTMEKESTTFFKAGLFLFQNPICHVMGRQ